MLQMYRVSQKRVIFVEMALTPLLYDRDHNFKNWQRNQCKNELEVSNPPSTWNNRQKFTALDLTLLKFWCLSYSIEVESSETPQQFFMDFRGVLAISTKIMFLRHPVYWLISAPVCPGGHVKYITFCNMLPCMWHYTLLLSEEYIL